MVPFGAMVCCHVVHSGAVLGREHTQPEGKYMLRAPSAWGGLWKEACQAVTSENSALLDIHFLGAAGLRKLRDT